MRRAFKAGVCVLAIATAASSVEAKGLKPQCAKDNEVVAIQATAVQQQLMVAALTCSEVANFNAFQTGYNKELRGADTALLKMFKRFYGKRGEAEYHAFKTRVANNAEMRSIHDNQGYCATAHTIFVSMSSDHPVFDSFVSGIPVAESSPVNACHISVAVNVSKSAALPAENSAQAPADTQRPRIRALSGSGHMAPRFPILRPTRNSITVNSAD